MTFLADSGSEQCREKLLLQGAEVLDAVEGDVVGVMLIVGLSIGFVVGGSHGGKEVVSFHQPIGVLKAMRRRVGMLHDDRTDIPRALVRRAG